MTLEKRCETCARRDVNCPLAHIRPSAYGHCIKHERKS